MNIDFHGAVDGGRINPADLAWNDPVPGIDRYGLANRDILCLRLRNLQLGFQASRFSDFGQDGSRSDTLSHFDGNLLHDAGGTRTNFQLFYLLAPQPVNGAELIDTCLLSRELCLPRLRVGLDFLLLHLVSYSEFPYQQLGFF